MQRVILCFPLGHGCHMRTASGKNEDWVKPETPKCASSLKYARAVFLALTVLLASPIWCHAGPSVTVMFNGARYVEACTSGQNLYVGALNQLMPSAQITRPAMYVNPGHNSIGGKPGYGPIFASVTYCEAQLK